MAQGNDGKGNKLTTLMNEAKAMAAIEAGIAKKGWAPERVKGLLRDEEFMHDFTDASLSYTPYMWAKAETGMRVTTIETRSAAACLTAFVRASWTMR